MGNEEHTHQQYHHYYTTFATLSEFLLAFSIHIVANLHFTAIAYSIAGATFAIYTAVTAAYLRYSVTSLRNLDRN
jgi:hypothetical protein